MTIIVLLVYALALLLDTTDLARFEPREITQRDLSTWERLANMLARSPLCPDYFRGKPGDIQIAFMGLHEIGVRPGPNVLNKCYVVKGRPGYMAQLQIGVAARLGHRIVCVEQSAETCTVKICLAGEGEWHHVTFTMEDAVRAKLPDQNPTYKTYPDRMLFARAVTKAIGMYCPGALLGLERSADVYENRSAVGHAEAEWAEHGALPAGQALPESSPVGVPGDGEVGSTPAGEQSWKDRAKVAGVRQADLIRQAQEIAGELNVDAPMSLEAITDPELCGRLGAWLDEQRA